MDAVLNWLWQGGVVALGAAVLLQMIPRSRTHSRYCALWTACAVVLVLPCVPFLLAAASPQQIATTTELSTSAFVMSAPRAWWTSNALVVVLWFVWATACSYQLSRAFLALRHTRQACRRIPRTLETRLHHWSRMKATGRRARLMLSPRVRAAAVLGCGSPIIGLAPALVEQLNADDLDRVVIHEWAHVQRRDDVAQYVQLIVRIVAGWHPAVWWLQRQLDLEREIACDEAAVAITGSAKAYAACLTAVAALPMSSIRPVRALAVSSSGLRHRLIRILALRENCPPRPWRGLSTAANAMLVTLALAVGDVRMVVTTPDASTSHNATAPTMEQNVVSAAQMARSAKQELPSTTPMIAQRFRVGGERIDGGRRGTSLAVTLEPESTTELAASIGAVPSSAGEASLDSPAVGPVETLEALELPVNTLISLESATLGDTGERDRGHTRAAWTAAADAGIAIGRRSQSAGVATAGFFSQFGKKVARSF